MHRKELVTMKNYDVVLASASPRRRELLEQIGIPFQVMVSEVEEKVTTDVPHQVVEQLSLQKAEAVAEKLCTEKIENADLTTQKVIIGADTIVSCDGEILGKPKDAEDAFRMLKMLQGRSHEVYTGVTFVYVSAEPSDCLHSQPEALKQTSIRRIKTFHEATVVEFYPMTDDEIYAYIETKDPMDKAGAYGIQGFCARYIKGITGDYNNVVGLPVGRLYQELQCLFPKKAVIFDLDGTLSDSINSIKYCGDKVMADYGYGPFSVEQYKYFVGDGAANLVKRALLAGGDSELIHFEEAFVRYKEVFRENCMYEVKPYAGIRELLAALKEKGVALAVLSNKPHVETIHVIETLFGPGFFDVILGQTDSVAIKPSPEGVFVILEKLGLSPEEVLYLGDTATDMKTGKSAGAFTVGALWGFREYKELSDNHADAIIEEPMQLLKYL